MQKLDFFQSNFDDEIQAEAAELQRINDAADPVFTLEDMEKAKQTSSEAAFDEGRSEGHAAGLKQAYADLAAQQLKASNALIEIINAMHMDRAAHKGRLESDMTDFTRDMAARIFPEIIRTYGDDRVASEITRIVKRSLGSPFLEITCAPDTAPVIRGIMDKMDNLGECRVNILENRDLDATELSARWKDGRSRYSFKALCEKILNLLKNHND